MSTILIIVLVVLLLGGGGYGYSYSRWRRSAPLTGPHLRSRVLCNSGAGFWSSRTPA
jgi:hypothetical protein